MNNSVIEYLHHLAQQTNIHLSLQEELDRLRIQDPQLLQDILILTQPEINRARYQMLLAHSIDFQDNLRHHIDILNMANVLFALLHLDGMTVEKKPDHTIFLLEHMSHCGNHFATYSLATLYLDDQYGAANIAKATMLLDLAIQHRNYQAMYLRAQMYYHGEGDKRDHAAAIFLLKNICRHRPCTTVIHALLSIYIDTPIAITQKELRFLARLIEPSNKASLILRFAHLLVERGESEHAEAVLRQAYAMDESIPEKIYTYAKSIAGTHDQRDPTALYLLHTAANDHFQGRSAMLEVVRLSLTHPNPPPHRLEMHPRFNKYLINKLKKLVLNFDDTEAKYYLALHCLRKARMEEKEKYFSAGLRLLNQAAYDLAHPYSANAQAILDYYNKNSCSETKSSPPPENQNRNRRYTLFQRQEVKKSVTLSPKDISP